MRLRLVNSKIPRALLLAVLFRHGTLWAASDNAAQGFVKPSIIKKDDLLRLRLSYTLEQSFPAESVNQTTPAIESLPNDRNRLKLNSAEVLQQPSNDSQQHSTSGESVLLTAASELLFPHFASLQPYVSVTVTHDDNLLRLQFANTLSQPSADTIKQGTVGLKVDWKQGRQELVLDASLNESRFSRFTMLDYQGVNLQSRWSWQLAHSVSGDIGYTKNTSLGTFTEQHNLVKYLTTQKNEFIDGAWQVIPLMRLSGSFSKATYKSESGSVYSNDSLSYVAGAYYTPSSGNEVGIRDVRQVQKYPVLQAFSGVSVDNGFTQDQLLATVNWLYSGHFRVNGQAGTVKRSHNQLTERDFNGKTMRGTLTWLASGKSQVDFIGWDEIDGYDDQTTSYTQSKGYSLGPSWNPTGKLGVSAKWQHLKRDFLGDPLLKLFPGLNIQARQDTVDTISLLVNYQPMRTINISTSIQSERRSSNQQVNDYSDKSINLNMSIGL